MTHKQILEKAIKIANKAGFGVNDGWKIPTDRFGLEMLIASGEYMKLIYNHDFAKSLFGIELHNGQPEWRNALQYIVVQDDPIEALGRLMER